MIFHFTGVVLFLSTEKGHKYIKFLCAGVFLILAGSLKHIGLIYLLIFCVSLCLTQLLNKKKSFEEPIWILCLVVVSISFYPQGSLSGYWIDTYSNYYGATEMGRVSQLAIWSIVLLFFFGIARARLSFFSRWNTGMRLVGWPLFFILLGTQAFLMANSPNVEEGGGDFYLSLVIFASFFLAFILPGSRKDFYEDLGLIHFAFTLVFSTYLYAFMVSSNHNPIFLLLLPHLFLCLLLVNNKSSSRILALVVLIGFLFSSRFGDLLDNLEVYFPRFAQTITSIDGVTDIFLQLSYRKNPARTQIRKLEEILGSYTPASQGQHYVVFTEDQTTTQFLFKEPTLMNNLPDIALINRRIEHPFFNPLLNEIRRRGFGDWLKSFIREGRLLFIIQRFRTDEEHEKIGLDDSDFNLAHVSEDPKGIFQFALLRAISEGDFLNQEYKVLETGKLSGDFRIYIHRLAAQDSTGQKNHKIKFQKFRDSLNREDSEEDSEWEEKLNTVVAGDKYLSKLWFDILKQADQ